MRYIHRQDSPALLGHAGEALQCSIARMAAMLPRKPAGCRSLKVKDGRHMPVERPSPESGGKVIEFCPTAKDFRVKFQWSVNGG